MNIEQINKDWEAHCNEYGFKPYIYLESMCTSSFTDSRSMTILKTSNNSNNAIKIIPDIVSVIETNAIESFFMQLLSYDKSYKLFTTFYEKLMEQE